MKLHCNHGNEDCSTNLHVQIFASAILILILGCPEIHIIEARWPSV